MAADDASQDGKIELALIDDTSPGVTLVLGDLKKAVYSHQAPNLRD